MDKKCQYLYCYEYGIQFKYYDLECKSNHMNIPNSNMSFTFIQTFKQSNNKG